MFEKEFVVDVPTCENAVQLGPWQRSTRYWVIVPPVSVAAVQLRLICAGPEATDERFVGAVKIGGAVVALAMFEYGPGVLEVSVARTR